MNESDRDFEEEALLPVALDQAGTKRCPWCAETIRAEAVKCRFCGSLLEREGLRFMTDPWRRPRQGRMIAGVCAGLAEQFGLSVTIVRLAFVLGAFFSGGVFVLVYVGMWLAMPDDEDDADRFGGPPIETRGAPPRL
jgi:phage shock protein PspC (stress-responsive transcriptional regulator)